MSIESVMLSNHLILCCPLLLLPSIFPSIKVSWLVISGGQNIGSSAEILVSLVAQMVKHLLIMWETWVQSLGWEDPLEKEMATHSSTLAWKIPWTEELRLHTVHGVQRVGHDWVTSLSLFSIDPSSEYSGLISLRIDWFDLLAVQETRKGLLQHHNSKASILQCLAYFVVQLSHLYLTTGKTIALSMWSFVGKLMSLLFNMLSLS